MPVAGLTVTLSADEALASAAVGKMFARQEILLGEVAGRFMAAVMDTPDSGSSRDLHRWIESLPGVEFVDVVYVGFDEEPRPSQPAAPRRAST